MASIVRGVNTKFLRDDSGFNATFAKNGSSPDLNIDVDFADSYLSSPMIGFHKEKGKLANLTAHLVAANQRPVILKNIELKGDDFHFKLSGRMGLRSRRVEAFRTQNFSYGQTNMQITYGDGEEEGTKDYVMKGSVLDVSKINPYDLKDLKEQKGYKDVKTNVVINIDKVILKNKKTLKNLAGKIACDKNSCADFDFSAGLYKEKMVTLVSEFDKVKSSGTIVSDIDLEVDDVGYFLNGFGMTNRIVGGGGRMKAKNKISDIFILDGNLIIDEPFEFIKAQYVNIVIEKDVEESKDIKDIQSLLTESDRIKFDKAQSRFKIKNEDIFIKNMMLNNLDMNLGLTIEGEMDIASGMIDINGIIIPSYKINSLFGLGKVPILGSIFVGEKGGGVFAPAYTFQKRNHKSPGQFKVSKASAIAPGVTRNIFNFFKFDRDSAVDDIEDEDE